MKKTVIEQIEIKRDGTVQIRFQLQVIDDGEVVAASWHRTMIPPGIDVDRQIAAVNSGLATMGKAAVEQDCVTWLKPYVAQAQTAEAIAAYAAKQEVENKG